MNDEAKKNLVKGNELALPNMDWRLNELYDFLYSENVNVISTSMSRYIVDLNRSPDSNLFGNYRESIVYKWNTWEGEIYETLPQESELRSRLKSYYVPYHEQLDSLVNGAIDQFGKCILVDLHSFMGPIDCDVCLGNLDGRSCSEALLNKFKNAFLSQRFSVKTNEVFKGGYITSKYTSIECVESMQIELRYTNYLHSSNYESVNCPPLDISKSIDMKERLRSAFSEVGVW